MSHRPRNAKKKAKKPFSIQAERAALSGADQKRLDEQLDVLARALGHRPRDDSQMAFLFARGETNKTLSETVNEIKLVNLIYDHTDYKATVEESLRDIAAKINDDGLAWGATWQIVRKLGPVMLKLDAMDQLL